jgi:hypothetical protein
MLEKERERTGVYFPQECYSASFYDYFSHGKRINLLEQKIVCSYYRGRKNSNRLDERNIVIVFYIEEIGQLVSFAVCNSLEVYNSINRDSKKVFHLEDYDAFDILNPMKTLAFLKDLEDKYIRCYKKELTAFRCKNLFEEYEKTINCNTYEIDRGLDHIFFLDYQTLYNITNITIATEKKEE